MQFVDKDLKSIQEARILVESARDAHFLLREYDQETLDRMIQRMITEVPQLLSELAAFEVSVTGKGNELMLENARKIAESGKTELIIRVPVIPTFNDTEKEIEEIANVQRTAVELTIPMKVDVEVSKRWGEGISFKEYIEKGFNE